MRVELSDAARKQLRKIDARARDRIIRYLFEIEGLEDPRSRGKALVENLKGFWRYRVGAYRVICNIDDESLLITAVKIGHRRDVYR